MADLAGDFQSTSFSRSKTEQYSFLYVASMRDLVGLHGTYMPDTADNSYVPAMILG